MENPIHARPFKYGFETEREGAGAREAAELLRLAVGYFMEGAEKDRQIDDLRIELVSTEAGHTALRCRWNYKGDKA